MSDKWIVVIIIAGLVLLGVLGLFLNGNFTRKEINSDYSKIEQTEKNNIMITSVEKGILKISILKETNQEKEEVEFEIKFDENGNVLNKEEINNLSDDESYKEEIDKVVNKCINEKLYLFDHVSQSYSSYYSKR